VLNFIHIALPHSPFSYFPDGDNYGRAWLRGVSEGRWGDDEWAIATGRQRHFLQTQLVDRLLDGLLDRLEQLQILNDALVVVVADHGISFNAGDLMRSLSADNAENLLRVPMFIKIPGQQTGQRFDQPVMTIDALPTILSILGVKIDAGTDANNQDLDGIDLLASPLPDSRDRVASANLNQIRLEESKLTLMNTVAETRSQLKLDDGQDSLWQIGPLDTYRGNPITAVCQPSDASVRIRWGQQQPSPNTSPERFIPAFVSGVVTSKALPDTKLPFVITSNGSIAGSGHTWKHKERWHFFVLIPPEIVKEPGWSPRVYVVNNGRCLGG
jgi:hypothetical protein